ncbi:hypothetical protein Xvie_01058 [Xenorhabdus vietnamensis]|uniref:Uncharacterized protein n=1 Tax=Xenorhabdus vietnamensis TaxID=351656 RepID=A0A1Y2SFV8_9GAMM|nr:hypothetical protein Xvie_01058 [Xenorhabdus vietnamensis]
MAIGHFLTVGDKTAVEEQFLQEPVILHFIDGRLR